MACTAQTAPPPRPLLRLQPFSDHAGAPALRLRFAPPGAFHDLPASAADFHANPVFAVPVYSLVPLDLAVSPAEPAPKRARIEAVSRSSAGDSALLALVKFLGGGVGGSERAAPVWEVYEAPMRDAWACVAHAKREIAERWTGGEGGWRMPKMVRDAEGEGRDGTGFCVVITSDRFLRGARPADEAGVGGSGIVWARWARGPTDGMGDGEVGFTRLRRGKTQFDAEGGFARLYARSFARRAIDCDLEEDPGEEVRGLEEYCDVGSAAEDVVEGGMGKGEEGDAAAKAELEKLADGLALEKFAVTRENDHVVVVESLAGSEEEGEAEPDLRYWISVPFLAAPRAPVSLEQVAKAFTASVTARLEEGTTVRFEFRQPTDRESYGVILEEFRARVAEEPEDFVGALLELEEDDDNPEFDGRLHCNGQSLRREDNVPEEEDEDEEPVMTRYKSFVVILRGMAIEAKGNVEYLLADAVPGSEAEVEYEEMMLWRNEGIEETVRRLEMKFDEDV